MLSVLPLAAPIKQQHYRLKHLKTKEISNKKNYPQPDVAPDDMQSPQPAQRDFGDAAPADITVAEPMGVCGTEMQFIGKGCFWKLTDVSYDCGHSANNCLEKERGVS